MKASVFLIALVGCAAPAMQRLTIENHTERAVDAYYVYKLGAADHGASRGTLAPHATVQLDLPQGNFEIQAVSAKLQLDEHTRERRTASSAIELVRPTNVVIYDAGDAQPAGAGVVEVVFQK